MTTQPRPAIGITVYPRHALDDPENVLDAVDRRYVTAVMRAGGLPILLPSSPHVDELLDRVDGLILSGGGDIEPARYGREVTSPVRGPLPDRDTSELALVTAARRRGHPVLGICRGLQCLNVEAGGTLVQDLVAHPQDELSLPCHVISVLPGTALEVLLGGAEVKVNSQHHQAVEQLGAGFQVCARGADGVVEAIESTTSWWAVGVQWHPEALVESAESDALFSELVARAQAFRSVSA